MRDRTSCLVAENNKLDLTSAAYNQSEGRYQVKGCESFALVNCSLCTSILTFPTSPIKSEKGFILNDLAKPRGCRYPALVRGVEYPIWVLCTNSRSWCRHAAIYKMFSPSFSHFQHISSPSSESSINLTYTSMCGLRKCVSLITLHVLHDMTYSGLVSISDALTLFFGLSANVLAIITILVTRRSYASVFQGTWCFLSNPRDRQWKLM